MSKTGKIPFTQAARTLAQQTDATHRQAKVACHAVAERTKRGRVVDLDAARDYYETRLRGKHFPSHGGYPTSRRYAEKPRNMLDTPRNQ